MIYDLLSKINQHRIVLASQSPRRQELLKQLALNFEVIPSNHDENGDRSHPINYVKQNAKDKAESVAEKHNVDLIIGSDTIVYFNKQILEKPKNQEEVISFLTSMSGKKHEVHTAVYLKMKSKDFLFSERSIVYFRPLPESLILAYSESDEAYDKAGAYGIQAIGASFVEKIEGCYFNIMGFPLSRFSYVLRKAYLEGHL